MATILKLIKYLEESARQREVDRQVQAWLDAGEAFEMKFEVSYRALVAWGTVPEEMTADEERMFVEVGTEAPWRDGETMVAAIARVWREAQRRLEEEAKERQRLSDGRGQKGSQKVDYLNDEDTNIGRAAAQAAEKSVSYVGTDEKVRETHRLRGQGRSWPWIRNNCSGCAMYETYMKHCRRVTGEEPILGV